MTLTLIILTIEIMLGAVAMIIRKRLKLNFEEEILIGEPLHFYNPLEAARIPLWQKKKQYQEMPTDPMYLLLFDFIYPCHANYARTKKSPKAIRVEKRLNKLSILILIWPFILIGTGVSVLTYIGSGE